MRLFFPQWQGGGNTTGIHTGAIQLRDYLNASNGGFEFHEVPVDTGHEIIIDRDIWNYRVILDQLDLTNVALEALNAEARPAVFMLAGDCGAEIAPVSRLNRLYDGDLALIWLDAHPDLNTPQSSPSKTFHGMPLRVLLGEGDPDILGKCSSMVRPEQVFMVAVRDIDPPEREFIRGNDLPIFGELKFNALYPPLASAIRAAGLHNVYIHLDLDVLDPREFPYLLFPTSHGLAGATLLTLIDALRRDFTCVGFSIVEYDAHIQWHDTLPDLLRNIADVFADTARNHDQK